MRNDSFAESVPGAETDMLEPGHVLVMRESLRCATARFGG